MKNSLAKDSPDTKYHEMTTLSERHTNTLEQEFFQKKKIRYKGRVAFRQRAAFQQALSNYEEAGTVFIDAP